MKSTPLTTVLNAVPSTKKAFVKRPTCNTRAKTVLDGADGPGVYRFVAGKYDKSGDWQKKFRMGKEQFMELADELRLSISPNCFSFRNKTHMMPERHFVPEWEPEWITSHSRIMSTDEELLTETDWVHFGMKLNPESGKQPPILSGRS